MGALSYADDITFIDPSIEGLNEMLKLCDNYATVYNVIFNSKKTVCIKFGNGVIKNEAAFLINQPLKWNSLSARILHRAPPPPGSKWTKIF